MQVTILEQDNTANTATIQFVHNGVTHTQKYDLTMVVPGTNMVLSSYNLQFTDAMRQTVISKLTDQVQREIEAGIIRNPL
jgi:hypothetical protein